MVERSRVDETRRLVAGERLRIAREVCGVVAHAMASIKSRPASVSTSPATPRTGLVRRSRRSARTASRKPVLSFAVTPACGFGQVRWATV